MVTDSVIMMLHRVGRRSQKRLLSNENMSIEDHELEKFVLDVKKCGWSFISLDELHHYVSTRGCFPKKCMLLTFDDGYYDNYTSALPVLESLGVPFCIYVTTGFVGSLITPWWYKLEEVLLSNQVICLPDCTNVVVDSMESKNIEFLNIRSRVMSHSDSSGRYLDWITEGYNSIKTKKTKLFLDWFDLDALSKHPMVTIGAHTNSHPVLSNFSQEDSMDDISLSKKLLQKNLSQEIVHFAYPYGGESDFSQKDADLVSLAGFKTAVTTIHGALESRFIHDLYRMPRVFFRPGLNFQQMRFSLFRRQLKGFLQKIPFMV